jgi:hypothetical protein
MMKSLIMAILGFALVVYGCRDVPRFKALKRKLKRTPGTRPNELN